MARIDFFGIQEQIALLLREDPVLEGVTVTVEEDAPIVDNMPWVGVYLRDRELDGELVSAGTRANFIVRYDIWCMEYSLESIAEAARARDNLLGKVELSLLRRPTLDKKVPGFKITGGDFENALEEGGFVMAGSIVAEVLIPATV